MRIIGRAFRVCLMVLLFCLSFVKGAGAISASEPRAQATPNELIAEVNALRAANGLPAYSVNSILMGTAQAQANYMAATGTVTHSGPGGISTTQRLLDAGYPLAGDLSLGGFRSENITAGSNKTAAQAVLEWQGDAPHLNTMLSPNLTEIGAGVAVVGSTVYLVIDCARPTTSGAPQAFTPSADQPEAGTSAPSDFIVPLTVSTPDAEGRVYHEVQYGHTLWAIAIAYEVKIDEIRALNNLGATTDIYQGDRLLIKEGAAPPAAATEEAPTSTPQSVSAGATPTPLQFPTAFPTATQVKAPAPGTDPGQGNSNLTTAQPASNMVIGIAVGIALLAILLAALFSWAGKGRAA